MKHWQIGDIAWDRFDPRKVDPATVPIMKAAAMVERNGTDYAAYLKSVFHDDPDFSRAADNWALEEVQHGDAHRHGHAGCCRGGRQKAKSQPWSACSTWPTYSDW